MSSQDVDSGDDDAGDNRWSCPVWSWFGLRGFRDDGNFVTPDAVTGWLAKWKYLSYTVAIIEANRTKNSNPRGMIGYVV
jgi:hypothetical protein